MTTKELNKGIIKKLLKVFKPKNLVVLTSLMKNNLNIDKDSDEKQIIQDAEVKATYNEVSSPNSVNNEKVVYNENNVNMLYDCIQQTPKIPSHIQTPIDNPLISWKEPFGFGGETPYTSKGFVVSPNFSTMFKE